MKRGILACMALLATTNVFAQEKNDSLTAWYNALQQADVSVLEGLMAPEDLTPFEYKIADLGVSQNRKEFIDSMAEWAGAIAGGSIEYKISESYEGGYTAIVCYRFTSDELLTQEEVGVNDTRITGIVQEAIGDSCDGF